MHRIVAYTFLNIMRKKFTSFCQALKRCTQKKLVRFFLSRGVHVRNACILIIISFPLPTHSFIPGLKPSFSANSSHRSLSFSSSRLTTWIPRTVYCYFWAYPFLLFSFFLFLHFLWSFPCGRLSELMSAFERTLKSHLVSYRIVSYRGLAYVSSRGIPLMRDLRYDTRCYFNVRSKADISQLNLPHGTNN